MDGMKRPQHLRERPPRWPRRDREDGTGPSPRWDRDLEALEDGAVAELYPAALVMEDLSESGDEQSMMRVLARYTVLRLHVLSVAGAIAGTSLRVERRVALEHLAMLPRQDWERRSLERLAKLCSETANPEIVGALLLSAECAAKRGQPMGAFALYRAGYELSLAHAWWAAAGAAARGVGRLARLEEMRRSERLWEKRAYVLERRAALAEAEPPEGEQQENDSGGDVSG